jgi:transcriptional regulator of met regulon
MHSRAAKSFTMHMYARLISIITDPTHKRQLLDLRYASLSRDEMDSKQKTGHAFWSASPLVGRAT